MTPFGDGFESVMTPVGASLSQPVRHPSETSMLLTLGAQRYQRCRSAANSQKAFH